MAECRSCDREVLNSQEREQIMDPIRQGIRIVAERKGEPEKRGQRHLELAGR